MVNRNSWIQRAGVGVAIAAAIVSASPLLQAQTDAEASRRGTIPVVEGERLPTGMRITPTAAPGAQFQPLNPDLPTRPDYLADHAVSTALSPDKRTLLVLTSGYNRNNGPTGSRIASESNEYVFVYDLTNGRPVKRQVLQMPNTFVGIAWNPSGKEFYVTGGVDDNVHIYALSGSVWAESGTPIDLGHTAGLGLDVNAHAVGIAVNASGTRLLVANYENDSVSLVDPASRLELAEFDLRPGRIDPAQTGVPGGEYPYWVTFHGDSIHGKTVGW